MKLGSLKSTQNRDGQLCLVNRTLTTAVLATHISPTLQHALEHWQDVRGRIKQD